MNTALSMLNVKFAEVIKDLGLQKKIEWLAPSLTIIPNIALLQSTSNPLIYPAATKLHYSSKNGSILNTFTCTDWAHLFRVYIVLEMRS